MTAPTRGAPASASATSTTAPARANQTAQKCETPRRAGIASFTHEIVRSTSMEELTIDELARETGMTVRNIRSHATRGLLPPPEVRARTGYYGPEHVARLRLILELQANGYNLGAIKHLLANRNGPPEEVLSFAGVLLAPFEDEQPEIVTAAE